MTVEVRAGLLVLVVAGCGGKTAGVTAQLPEPGSPACEQPDVAAGNCVLCSDERYHCTGPAGLDGGIGLCPADAGVGDLSTSGHCCVSSACAEMGTGVVCGLPSTCKQ